MAQGSKNVLIHANVLIVGKKRKRKKMDKDLLVICPTRERLESCLRMIHSFDNKSSNRSKLIFIIDYDDDKFKEYKKIFSLTNHPFIIRYQKSVCEIHNMMVTQLYPNYNFYSIVCDDFIYHTGSWDKILMKKLIEKGGGFAYGDDGFGGQALPTTCVISGEIIRSLGWIVQPTLKYLCGDLVWRELGQNLNRLFYVPDVKIEHMTHLAGKSEIDNTFKRTNSNINYTEDNKSFRTWRSNNLKNDLEKIRIAIEKRRAK